MTKLDRSKMICFLFLGVLVLAAISCSQKYAPAPEQTAKTSAVGAEQIAKT